MQLCIHSGVPLNDVDHLAFLVVGSGAVIQLAVEDMTVCGVRDHVGVVLRRSLGDQEVGARECAAH